MNLWWGTLEDPTFTQVIKIYLIIAAAAAKSLQSCPTLCNHVDGSLPGSPIPGILQARTLEWVAISFSNAWKWKVKLKSLSRVRLFETPWPAAYQAPLPMGLSRQEYWSRVPLPSPTLPTGGGKTVLEGVVLLRVWKGRPEILGNCHCLLPTTLFWSAFLLKTQFIPLREFPCMLFPLLLLIFSLCL